MENPLQSLVICFSSYPVNLEALMLVKLEAILSYWIILKH